MKYIYNKFLSMCLLSLLVLLMCCNNNSNVKNIESVETNTTDNNDSDVLETYGDEQELLDKIIENGEIMIGMECSLEPFSYYDDIDNELVGYDVEIGNEIAKKLGVNANFVECHYSELLDGLNNGIFDIVIDGIYITDEIKKDFDFTNPYAYTTTSIIVNDVNDGIKDFDDLNGKKVSCINKSVYEDIAKKYGASVVKVDDLYQSIDTLLQNKVVATINSTNVYKAYKESHKGENIKIAAELKNKNAIAMPIRKGNKSLLDKINSILDDMRKDGTLKSLSEKYFGEDITNK